VPRGVAGSLNGTQSFGLASSLRALRRHSQRSYTSHRLGALVALAAHFAVPHSAIDCALGRFYKEVPHAFLSIAVLMRLPKCPPGSFVLAAILLGGCNQQRAPITAAAPIVAVAPVEQRDVPIVDEWIGTLDGSANVDIHARVQGYGDYCTRSRALIQIAKF
jgi:hypothetical protein